MELLNQERAPDGRVTLVVKAAPEQVRQAVEQVYRDLAQRVSIPGFRKGKVPRALLEREVSLEEARRIALDDLAGPTLVAGLRQIETEPYTAPQIEKSELEPDGSATFAASFVPRPKVELGEYRGLAAVRSAIEVTDEQVEAELYKTRERYARYEPAAERPAQRGDVALVDYDLMVEGQVVERQSAQGYPCQVGGDTLFPELSEKLVGLRPGEQVRVPARFAEDHPEPALAGKTGEYVVTVRQVMVRVVPELTDEMAREAHNVESAAELRQMVRALLEALAQQEMEQRLRRDLLEQVMASSRVEIAPALVRLEAEARLERLRSELLARGETLENYLREEGIDLERWLRREEMNARWSLERAFVLEEIARREGIEVSQQEVSAEIAAIARRVGKSANAVRQALREPGVGRIADRMQQHKVLQLLVEHADITNEGEPLAAEAPAPQQEGQP